MAPRIWPLLIQIGDVILHQTPQIYTVNANKRIYIDFTHDAACFDLCIFSLSNWHWIILHTQWFYITIRLNYKLHEMSSSGPYYKIHH